MNLSKKVKNILNYNFKFNETLDVDTTTNNHNPESNPSQGF